MCVIVYVPVCMCVHVSARLQKTSCPASALAPVVPAGMGRGCSGGAGGIRDANIPVKPGNSPGVQMNYADLV